MARFERSIFGRWVIVHPEDDGLAWSGSRWVPHERGIPTGEAQVANFESEQEARDYAEAWI